MGGQPFCHWIGLGFGWMNGDVGRDNRQYLVARQQQTLCLTVKTDVFRRVATANHDVPSGFAYGDLITVLEPLIAARHG